ncbi:MAG: SCO family protein [Gammaproteobacteria bacterium]|nr:SCO family protein [Gammaproteobacteria bacterium]MCW8986901.1 SCO family protein [Gammaproteobacteria bacterium]MCW9030765.1 SCO family protein [Gammaproteobacteria bacterium]
MRQLSVYFMLIISLLFSVSLKAESSLKLEAKSNGAIQKFQNKSALEASQAAIGNQLSNFQFTDSSGRGLKLHELKGKPLVLSLIFTSCYQTCPMTTRYLSSVVEKAREALGHDKFSVAVLGFDSQFDSPQAMKHFAKKQGIENANWYLLSADPKTIKAFTKELGFLFFTSPNGFDHMVQATIIDAESVIYRQVYGEVFDTPLLIEPLKELILGRPQPNQTILADLINKVRFFCTNYDPASDSYHFDYSLFIGMLIGALIIIIIVVFLVQEYRYLKRVNQT